jgi:amidase
VGIKPTVGLTSRHLVIPISEHQDTVGPMARTVKDAAAILQTIAGKDSNDNYTQAIPNDGQIPDYVAACDPNALKQARIGVPFNILPPINNAEMFGYLEAIDIMFSAGAEIVDANFSNPNPSLSGLILEVDFKTNLPQYFDQLTYNPNNVTNLKELREFTTQFPEEAYPDRNTAVWDSSLNRNFSNSDSRFWEAYQQDYTAVGEGGVLGAVSRTEVDAIVLPASWSPGRAAVIGAPIITVPFGFWPSDTPVQTNARGLVTQGPNFP